MPDPFDSLPSRSSGGKRYKALAFSLVALILVGCAEDTPEVLVQDVQRAWSTGNVELLESRVDVESVLQGISGGLRANAREQLGGGFFATMALADMDRGFQALEEEIRDEYTRAREDGDLAELRATFRRKAGEVTSFHIEEAGDALRVRIVLEAQTGRAVVYFPLGRRDGRWMVTGLGDLVIR